MVTSCRKNSAQHVFRPSPITTPETKTQSILRPRNWSSVLSPAIMAAEARGISDTHAIFCVFLRAQNSKEGNSRSMREKHRYLFVFKNVCVDTYGCRFFFVHRSSCGLFEFDQTKLSLHSRGPPRHTFTLAPETPTPCEQPPKQHVHVLLHSDILPLLLFSGFLQGLLMWQQHV